jgi:hypothetical protein
MEWNRMECSKCCANPAWKRSPKCGKKKQPPCVKTSLKGGREENPRPEERDFRETFVRLASPLT